MVVLMGGRDSPGFHAFCQLTVKAFLACRPYAEDLCLVAELMLGTQLPSFKGMGTIHRLRDRFKPEMTEKAAGIWMEGVIRNAFENRMSTFYDAFQKYQNEIPY
jgi:phosphatidylinositol 4-kinase A